MHQQPLGSPGRSNTATRSSQRSRVSGWISSPASSTAAPPRPGAYRVPLSVVGGDAVLGVAQLPGGAGGPLAGGAGRLDGGGRGGSRPAGLAFRLVGQAAQPLGLAGGQDGLVGGEPGPLAGVVPGRHRGRPPGPSGRRVRRLRRPVAGGAESGRAEVGGEAPGADQVGGLGAGRGGVEGGRDPVPGRVGGRVAALPQQPRGRLDQGGHGLVLGLAGRPQLVGTLAGQGGPLGGAQPLPGGQQRAQPRPRSEEHTSELQSLTNLVCRLLLEKKKKKKKTKKKKKKKTKTKKKKKNTTTKK